MLGEEVDVDDAVVVLRPQDGDHRGNVEQQQRGRSHDRLELGQKLLRTISQGVFKTVPDDGAAQFRKASSKKQCT